MSIREWGLSGEIRMSFERETDQEIYLNQAW